jgi:predicted metal-binding protein
MTTTLYVCTTCKVGEANEDDSQRPGARLHRALEAAGAPDGVQIVGVSCLSACKTGAAVALSEPGKWTYVYGHMNEEHVPDILAGASAYAASADGIVPWRERPVIFRKQSVARVPALTLPLEAAE